MNRVVRTLCVGAGFFTVVAVGAANAQVTDPITFKTTFPFMAGSTVLPAGAYRVEAVDDDTHMLEITSAKPGGAHTFIEVEDATPPTEMKKTEVVFKRYGDQYVLKNVWLAGESVGATVTTTRAERRREKAAAGMADLHLPANRGKALSLARK